MFGLFRPANASAPNFFNVIKAVNIEADSLRNDDAYWEIEHRGQSGAAACHDRLVKISDSTFVEFGVNIVIAIDLVLTFLSFVLPSEQSESTGVFVLSALIVFVLLLDVIIRVLKDGTKFFIKFLNWIEFGVAIGGAAACIYDISQRASNEDPARSSGAAFGRAIRPALRVFRVFRGFFNFLGGRGGLQARLDASMDKIMDVFIRRMIKGILLVPGENVSIRPSSGEFHLEKAQVCSSNLEGLHLPLALKAGIFDMIHFQLKFGKIARGSHRLMLVIENVILVVGPGHHQEPPASAWEYDTVLAAKTKLINLACHWIEIFAKPRKQSDPANAPKNPGSVRKEKRGMSNWIKNRGTKLLKNILSAGMHLSINNLEIRYEDDTSDICGPYRVLGGVVMETLQLRAVSARHRPHDASGAFRTTGHWRPGPGKLAAEAEHPRRDFTMKDLNVKSLLNLGMKKMHDVFDFHHGIQGGIHGHGFQVFFDLIPRKHDSPKDTWSPGHKDETSILSSYGERLRDNSGCAVTDFLKQRQRLRKWEKVRLGLCSHIMSKLLEKRKKTRSSAFVRAQAQGESQTTPRLGRKTFLFGRTR